MREHETSNRSQPGLPRGATRSVALLLCLGTLAGVLIWAKLRLVTDIPRSAYADPRDEGAGADDGADGGGSEAGAPEAEPVPGDRWP